MKKGKFIVFYGANNLGKTLQVTLLEKYLAQKKIPVKRVKYPVYDLEPTGPVINAVLRKGKLMPEDELQKLYVQNRKDYEDTLKNYLQKGMWVIAEDYKGTGIAWGMVRGVPLTFLEKINEGLLPEDIAIVFYGKRFETGKEHDHRNENDDTIWQKAYDNHMVLAKKYKWNKIFANQSIEKVQQDITALLTEKKVLV
jgi:thymidylate kinase